MTLRSRTAAGILSAVIFSALIAWDGPIDFLIIMTAASFPLALTSGYLRHRSYFLFWSFISCLIGIFAFFAWHWSAGGFAWEDFLKGGHLLYEIGIMLILWVAAGFVLMAFPEMTERLFGVNSRIRLQECLDTDRPVLRRLMEEAPGTYQPCLLVAGLAESGAEAAGGDGLLARAGGFYHDLGKLARPEYFSENQRGVNPHDRLEPSLSAFILFGHARDGAEYAEDIGLSPGISAIAREHHGTTLAGYFFFKAKKNLEKSAYFREKKGNIPIKELESQFRYPGPLPHSKEAAAVMMADVLEAVVRSEQAKDAGSIQSAARRMFIARLTDGQFAESGLRVDELERMEKAMVKMLSSMYHERVQYSSVK
jgi:putative nucleotidyltransferase with HDIG domain